MNIFRLLVSLMILGSQITMTGCAPALLMGGAAAGATIAAYIKGELVSRDVVTLDEAWQCTQDAVKDMGLIVIDTSKDHLSAKLIARTSDDTRIEIHFKKEAIHSTQIRIRAGIFGDETFSRQILKEIQSRYKTIK